MNTTKTPKKTMSVLTKLVPTETPPTKHNAKVNAETNNAMRKTILFISFTQPYLISLVKKALI